MTAFFVKTFKRENQCGQCKKDKLSGYSLCAAHLERAKLRFRQWAVERRAAGRCTSCDRMGRRPTRYHHSRPNGERELKCAQHRNEMLARTRAWHSAHPNHSHEDWLKRKKYLDFGRCPGCPEHRKLPAGQKRCTPCQVGGRFGRGSVRHLQAVAAAGAA